MESDTHTKELTNGEKIAKLDQLYLELDILKEEASDAIKLAKLNKEKESEITRKDGKKQTIKQQLLWDEVRVVGDQTEAYDFLRGLYPLAFEKSEAVSAKAHEVDDFCMVQFGIHADRMTVRDIIKLIKALTSKE